MAVHERSESLKRRNNRIIGFRSTIRRQPSFSDSQRQHPSVDMLCLHSFSLSGVTKRNLWSKQDNTLGIYQKSSSEFLFLSADSLRSWRVSSTWTLNMFREASDTCSCPCTFSSESQTVSSFAFQLWSTWFSRCLHSSPWLHRHVLFDPRPSPRLRCHRSLHHRFYRRRTYSSAHFQQYCLSRIRDHAGHPVPHLLCSHLVLLHFNHSHSCYHRSLYARYSQRVHEWEVQGGELQTNVLNWTAQRNHRKAEKKRAGLETHRSLSLRQDCCHLFARHNAIVSQFLSSTLNSLFRIMSIFFMVQYGWTGTETVRMGSILMVGFGVVSCVVLLLYIFCKLGQMYNPS